MTCVAAGGACYAAFRGHEARNDSHLGPPWQEMKRMTDDDLRALDRYLRTVPPIRNAVVKR